jgi:spoIIIJ-associated protein
MTTTSDAQIPQDSAPEETASLAHLEQEGDVAADYIEELLDIADIDGDIELDVRAGRAYVSVEAPEGGTTLSVLSDPETVRSLQELTRLAVQNKTGRFSRQGELEQLVSRAIERLEEGAGQASLPPMSSYERKLIHDIVADRGFVSESYGDGADRHTVIRRS